LQAPVAQDRLASKGSAAGIARLNPEVAQSADSPEPVGHGELGPGRPGQLRRRVFPALRRTRCIGSSQQNAVSLSPGRGATPLPVGPVAVRGDSLRLTKALDSAAKLSGVRLGQAQPKVCRRRFGVCPCLALPLVKTQAKRSVNVEMGPARDDEGAVA